MRLIFIKPKTLIKFFDFFISDFFRIELNPAIEKITKMAKTTIALLSAMIALFSLIACQSPRHTRLQNALYDQTKNNKDTTITEPSINASTAVIPPSIYGFSGRFSVDLDDKKNKDEIPRPTWLEDALIGSFDYVLWRPSLNALLEDQIDLLSPFGQTLLRIIARDDGVQIQREKIETDAETISNPKTNTTKTDHRRDQTKMINPNKADQYLSWQSDQNSVARWAPFAPLLRATLRELARVPESARLKVNTDLQAVLDRLKTESHAFLSNDWGQIEIDVLARWEDQSIKRLLLRVPFAFERENKTFTSVLRVIIVVQKV